MRRSRGVEAGEVERRRHGRISVVGVPDWQEPIGKRAGLGLVTHRAASGRSGQEPGEEERDSDEYCGDSQNDLLGKRERPELYQAFVGVGQMVNQRETDRIFYRDTLAWARETGKSDVVATLTEIGASPYETILPYESALTYEHEVYPYDHSQNAEGEGGFSENLFVEEYTLLEQIHALGAMMDTFSVLYPQLQEIDFREDATRLEVPVYLVQGRHEARGRAVLANEWFEQLEAPSKEMIVLDTSGHRPLFEQPGRFNRVMTETVLAETQPGS